jgi:hypothetical protein
MTAKDKIENGAQNLIDALILFLEDSRFFMPSPELTDRIGARLAALSGMKPKNSVDGRFLLQRKISEQLYYHLRTWADNPDASKGKPMVLREMIVSRFGKSIGLGTEEADRVLLDTITNEVTSWIEQHEHFTAGWGEITHAGEGSVILRAISDESKLDGMPSIVSKKHPFPEVKPKTMAR